jgi:hypothetical protein
MEFVCFLFVGMENGLRLHEKAAAELQLQEMSKM